MDIKDTLIRAKKLADSMPLGVNNTAIYTLIELANDMSERLKQFEWQPIKSAPKNTEVIVAIQGGGVTIGAMMTQFGWHWIEVDDEPEDARAIAWMPLPQPPKENLI